MIRFAKPTIILLSLSLTACTGAAFNNEAGDIDQGDFGNASMQNTLIATGQIQAPMGHDKYDPPAARRKLNGKYAAMIGQTYIAEGTRPHPAVASSTSEVNPGAE